MSESANAEQTAFWNAEPGQRWVTREADLDALHAAVTDLLLAACAPLPGEAILDVGCGAGATLLAFAGAVGPTGRVLGLDVSEPLAARARDRAAEAGFGGTVDVAVCDAQTAALPTRAFDAAISRFGVMFFEDPVAAFRNIAGALSPGGRVCFAAWGGLESNPWFRDTMRVAVDRLDPGAPQQQSGGPGPMAFADRARVVGLLDAAGLVDCRATAMETELHHPGGVAALVDLAAAVGPTARLMREKGGTAEDLAAIRAGLAAALSPCATPDGVRIPAEVILYEARRPPGGAEALARSGIPA